ncbi:MAG: hypothetical protein WCK89_24260, partial [bacterium]
MSLRHYAALPTQANPIGIARLPIKRLLATARKLAEPEPGRQEQDNIVEALTWLDRAKPTDILNEQFVKE